MRRERKAGVGVSTVVFVTAVIVVMIGLAGFGIYLASRDGKGSSGGGTASRDGIDRDAIVNRMTSESDTVIFFDDRGAVVSTSHPTVRGVCDAATEPNIIVPWIPAVLKSGLEHIAEVRAMKGKVRFTRSAKGIGNRLDRKKAEQLLEDYIRHQP